MTAWCSMYITSITTVSAWISLFTNTATRIFYFVACKVKHSSEREAVVQHPPFSFELVRINFFNAVRSLSPCFLVAWKGSLLSDWGSQHRDNYPTAPWLLGWWLNLLPLSHFYKFGVTPKRMLYVTLINQKFESVSK